MFELIIAVDKNNGIGNKNKLPWKCSEELKIFKNKTENNIVVFGSKTLKFLPYLPNREIYCLSRTNPDIITKDSIINSSSRCSSVLIVSKNTFNVINNLDEIPKTNKTVFIAGGSEIYNLALSNPKYVNKVHISIMKKEYDCDKYFNHKLLENFVIIEEIEHEEFIHYVMERTNYGERQYLNLLYKITENGIMKTCRNGDTISLFTEHFKFDLRNGFPLLTTKKMFLRGIIEEFLFFIRGETDSRILSDKKVRIWEGNTSKEFLSKKGLNYGEGVMGPMYGYQWRNFGKEYKINENGYPINNENDGIDQLSNVIQLIKTDPNSRRILMTSYNPLQAEEGVLYPCHSISIQFYVENEYLDMFCFNRSQDTFLGVPYNIASSSLLLMLIAKLTNKIPRFFNMSMGDTHLYNSHIVSAQEQQVRTPYKFPNIRFPDILNISDIQKLKYEDFILTDYKYHPTIKADMIA